MNRLAGLLPDKFLIALVTTVIVATVLPAYGEGAVIFGWLATAAVSLLFFLQGVRLPWEATLAGLTHWRLHVFVFCCTFVLFPLLGLALHAVAPWLLIEPLWIGILFVCALPSTVQSSIALVAIAHGNVPAAIFSATASNILGIIITPILIGLMLSLRAGGGIDWSSIGSILLQLLVPFVAGQLLRPWLKDFAQHHRPLLTITDRSSIIFVVYVAFSKAVIDGLWSKVPLRDLAVVLGLDGLLLAVVLLVATFGSKLFGFSRRDEVAIAFCGSQKSLVSGVPIANVLFPGPIVGLTLLPLMIYHQTQLMTCTVLARRFAAKAEAEEAKHA
jgi:sodium/bile acid cotransporter 7